jgi:hypothetical protein
VLFAALKQMLFELHKGTEGREILATIGIKHFVPVQPGLTKLHVIANIIMGGMTACHRSQYFLRIFLFSNSPDPMDGLFLTTNENSSFRIPGYVP